MNEPVDQSVGSADGLPKVQPQTGFPAPEAFLNCNMDVPKVLSICGGQAAVYSRAGPFRETANEDSALAIAIDERSGLLAVADGMGGHACGDLASRAAIESLRDCLLDDWARPAQAAKLQAGSLRNRILDGFEVANEAVRAVGHGAGTTLAAVEVSEGQIRTLHAGDSAIFVIGGRGKLKFASTSHSIVGYALEAGYVDEQGALEHEYSHVVLNALGDEAATIEVSLPIGLATQDTLILATDGLTDNLTAQRVADLAHSRSAKGVVEALIGEYNAVMADEDRAKPDDITVIAYTQGGQA